MLLVVFLFTGSFVGSVFAEDNTVSESEAVNVAYNFLLSHLANPIELEEDGDQVKNGVNSVDSGWKEGILITKVTPMYSLNDMVSAYLVELGYEENKEAGYIVVSGNKNSYPII